MSLEMLVNGIACVWELWKYLIPETSSM